jgi:two-component system, chemotaxis family, chemotaxis protein CheY
MFEEYIKILAKCCRTAFKKMTKARVIRVSVERDEPVMKTYSIARSIPYEDFDKNISGHFVLGFTDEETAISVASAIGENMGLPAIEQFDETASDIINEFMNVVVGHTISEWDALGFSVRFSHPEPLDTGNTQENDAPPAEAHLVVLKLESRTVMFRVSFSKTTDNLLQNKRILLVDDSTVIRNILTKTLETAGCKVEQAANGNAAVEKHRIFKPDLTVMDLIMPELGGLDAILQIQTSDPEAKFLVLTSTSRKDEVVTAKTLNVLAYLIKPVDSAELLERVRAAFRES